MTIYDIAELAGVSIATVSRVMQGKANVSPKTKEKVERVMKEQGYVPSMIARGMSSKSLKTVAIVIQDFSNNHHMKIAHEIESYFSIISYNVVMYEAGSSSSEILRFLSRMKELSIDGIILIGSVFQLLEENKKAGMEIIGDKPVIIANGWIPGTYGLDLDEAAGEKKAVTYLAGRGITDMLFVCFNDTQSSRKKYKGFEEGCRECGIRYKLLRLKDKDDMETFRKYVESIELKKGKSAVLTADDRIALLVQKTIHSMGLRVPEDISVVGYDDSEYAVLATPSMTTLDNHAYRQGNICADLLTKLLEKKEDVEKGIFCRIEPELIVRDSTI